MARQTVLTPPRGGPVYLTSPGSGSILQPGGLGFGAAPRQFWTDSSPALDGALLLGMRRSVRELTLPVLILNNDAVSCLAAYRALARSLAPESGPTVITTTEADTSDPRSISAYFTGGMEGNDSTDAYGQTWRKFLLSFQTFGDPFWNGAPGHQTWRSESAVPFFPILPVKLAPSQILSGLNTGTIRNYVSNPSFEVNAGWGVNGLRPGTPGMVQSFVRFQSGSASGLVTWPTTASANQAAMLINLTGLTVGQQYTASAYVYVPTGNPAVGIDIYALTTQVTSSTTNAWQRLSFVFTATNTAHSLEFINGAATTAGQQAFIDAVMVSDGSTLQTYGDGDQAGWSWNGAAGLSTSVKPASYDATQTITNPGDAEAYPVWTITGPGASVLLTNQDTGEYINLATTINAGQIVTINTKPQVASITDQTGANLWPYLTVGSSLWTLAAGANNVALVVTGTTSASQLDLDYATRFETA